MSKQMKLLMESFNSYIIEESVKSFEELYENQNKELAQKMAALGKQLLMAKKNPQEFIKQFVDKTEKEMNTMQQKLSGAKDGDKQQAQPEKYSSSKEAAAAALSDPKGALEKINKDIMADQQAIKQLDKAGDQAIKQAEPNELDIIKKADAEVNSVFDQSRIMSKHIFDQFKQAAKTKNLELMNAAQNDFIGFGKYTDNVIEKIKQAFNSKEWNKISKLSSDFKSMVQDMISA